MAFKEMAIRGAQNESAKVGNYVSTGVKVVTTALGAVAGGMGALGGSGGLGGAVMGGLRVGGISSPGAQIAMSSIMQAKTSQEANDLFKKSNYSVIDRAEKIERIDKMLPAEYIKHRFEMDNPDLVEGKTVNDLDYEHEMRESQDKGVIANMLYKEREQIMKSIDSDHIDDLFEQADDEYNKDDKRRDK